LQQLLSKRPVDPAVGKEAALPAPEQKRQHNSSLSQSLPSQELKVKDVRRVRRTPKPEVQKTRPPRKWLPHLLLKKFISNRHKLNQQLARNFLQQLARNQLHSHPSKRGNSNSSLGQMSKMGKSEVRKIKFLNTRLRWLLRHPSKRCSWNEQLTKMLLSPHLSSWKALSLCRLRRVAQLCHQQF
jgi:hypothetical protein